VYDGDRPTRSAWQEAVAQAEVLLVLARTDPEAARQVLFWMTATCRSLARFEEQRAYLFGAGIPATSAQRRRARPYRPSLTPTVQIRRPASVRRAIQFIASGLPSSWSVRENKPWTITAGSASPNRDELP